MKKRKKLLSILLAVCLVTTLIPGTVFAAGTGEAVQTFSAGTVNPTGSGAARKYSKIYYGVNGSTPLSWYVLSGNRAIDGKTDGLLLFSEKRLGISEWAGGNYKGVKANPGQANATDYKGSKVRDFCLSVAKNANHFSTLEQSSMLGVNKAAEGNVVIEGNTYANHANSGLNTDDKIFVLSMNEIRNNIHWTKMNMLKIPDSTDNFDGAWWTRSRLLNNASYTASEASKLGEMGTFNRNGNNANNPAYNDLSVRPGMNLSKKNILFLSAANNTGHKDFGMTADYNGTEWKLTLKDGNSFADGASVDAKTYEQGQGKLLTITHKALSSVSPDYTNVTAALFNSSGRMVYYGSINSSKSATKSTLSLPKNCPVGDYTLRVYGEDWNDAKRTDYATGTPFETTLTVKEAVVPTSYINYSKLTDGHLGQAYNQQIVLAPNTTLPVTWSISEGSLPDGLKLNQDGTITGTPTKLGKFQFRVRAENAGGYYQPQITLTISKTSVNAMASGGEKIKGYKNNGGKYDYIYFGKNGDANIKWRVLDDGVSNGETADSGLLLLSDNVLGQTQFDESTGTWKDSKAKDWCDAAYNSYFTGEEREAVLEMSKTEEDIGHNGSTYTGGELSEDHLFFLSTREVLNEENVDYGLGTNENRKAKDTNGETQDWWLRTVNKSDEQNVGYVKKDGTVSSIDVKGSYYARPAFLLSPDPIHFASGADNSMHQDFGAIEEHAGNEWKLTLWDDNEFYDGTALNKTTFTAGETLQIRHKALEDISPDYNNVTMALEDKSGKICYYGSINKSTSAEVSVVTIPSDLAAGEYELYVYGEDWNEKYETDYATWFPFSADIEIRDSAPVGVMYLPDGHVGYTYDDDDALDATGSGYLVWSVASGSLPDGLKLNQDGSITGKPTREGVYTFTVKVEGDLGSSQYPVRIRVYDTIPVSDGSGGINAGGGEGAYKLIVPEIDPNFEDDDIMHDLQWLRHLNTVEEIHENMKAQIMAREKSIEDTKIYNVVLMYSDDGISWKRAGKEHFPDGGKVLVHLPVPEGTDPVKHDYIVSHMFSMDAFGHNAGDVEFPDDIKEVEMDGKWYLEFHVTGLSPITVGWTEKDLTSMVQTETEESENPTEPTKPTEPANPADQGNDPTDKEPEGDGTATGDDSSMGVWFGMVGISVAAMAVLAVTAWRRRRTG